MLPLWNLLWRLRNQFRFMSHSHTRWCVWILDGENVWLIRIWFISGVGSPVLRVRLHPFSWLYFRGEYRVLHILKVRVLRDLIGSSSSEYPRLFRAPEKNKMASRLVSVTEDETKRINGCVMSENSLNGVYMLKQCRWIIESTTIHLHLLILHKRWWITRVSEKSY